MSDKWDYSEKPVVGHSVQARIEQPSPLSKQVDKMAAALGLERLFDSPMVRIEVGDVDWDESKYVRVRLDTLMELTETLVEEYGDD